MLKSHIKEELMQGEEDESVYESMAHLSTDLLMKCSLNPGSDEELYESMAGFVPGAPEDLCMYIHRVTESWEGLGWKVPLKRTQSKPSAMGGVFRSDCSDLSLSHTGVPQLQLFCSHHKETLLQFHHWLTDKIALYLFLIDRVQDQELFPQCFKDSLNPEQINQHLEWDLVFYDVMLFPPEDWYLGTNTGTKEHYVRCDFTDNWETEKQELRF